MNCICCNIELKRIDSFDGEPMDPDREQPAPHLDMWDGGAVNAFYCGYGSKFDTNDYAIALCDECIREKEKAGVITMIDDNVYL